MPESNNSKTTTGTATKKKSTTSTAKATENKEKVVKKVTESTEIKKETKPASKTTTKKATTSTSKPAEKKNVSTENKTTTKKATSTTKKPAAPKSTTATATKTQNKTTKTSTVKSKENKVDSEATKTTKKSTSLDEILKNKEETKTKKTKPEPVDNVKIEESKKDSMEDTVSLKEIRNALESKVDENQKRNIIKENILNVLISIAIILYLIIIFTVSKNIKFDNLENCLKAFSIGFAVIGLIMLEISYKKDSFKIAISAGEILVFGAINLCMMYVVKLYPSNLLNVTTYISIGVAVYYLAKIVILSIKNINKCKKDNNDIKEIIKK